ncbi:hypothetical protein C0Q70_11240 [Pomacea canaliculata]|uniref:Eukaryotic translation initiation factor 4C n=1 Tax=Pomacea canaliculata TaxID=400727 RepID=A0A2T7P5G5_POMCA|nr:hypothetical protein C0Q70_11240 [Pomacea canaliculata]
MEKSKFQTVVQGEASESDDDEVHVSSVNIKPFPSRVLQTSLESKKTAGGQAVVVEGEASESEEEEEVEVDTSLNSTKLPPLKVEPQKKVQYGSSGDLSDVPTLMSPRMADLRFNKPKYDTLGSTPYQMKENLDRKGGKNRRRGKNENENEKRELVFKEDGQEYAQVTKMLGNGRLEAMCFDGVKRLCHIRGKLRKKVWINSGDIILLGLRDYQDTKADVILKYTADEARNLKAYGELPESAKINENAGMEDDLDENITFDNFDDDEDDDDDAA